MKGIFYLYAQGSANESGCYKRHGQHAKIFREFLRLHIVKVEKKIIRRKGEAPRSDLAATLMAAQTLPWAPQVRNKIGRELGINILFIY